MEQASVLLTLAHHNNTKKNATYLQGELFHSAFHSLGGCQLRGAHINFAHTPTTPLGGGTQGSLLLVTEGPHLCMLRMEGLQRPRCKKDSEQLQVIGACTATYASIPYALKLRCRLQVRVG